MAQVDPDHKEAIRQQLESYRDVNLPQETQLAIYSKARVGLTDDMEGKYPGRRHWGNRSYIVPGHLTNNEVAAIHARWEDWTVGFDALLFMLDLLPSYTEAGASQVKAAIELTLAPSVSGSKTFEHALLRDNVFQVLPSFDHYLAGVGNFLWIVTILVGQHPTHEGWLNMLHTSSQYREFETPKRRWRLLLACFKAIRYAAPSNGGYPSAVNNALQALTAALPAVRNSPGNLPRNAELMSESHLRMQQHSLGREKSRNVFLVGNRNVD
ncbi:hypothetical protein JCM3766R1_000440 [Sporobolomyces carnicolor]